MKWKPKEGQRFYYIENWLGKFSVDYRYWDEISGICANMWRENNVFKTKKDARVKVKAILKVLEQK